MFLRKAVSRFMVNINSNMLNIRKYTNTYIQDTGDKILISKKPNYITITCQNHFIRSWDILPTFNASRLTDDEITNKMMSLSNTYISDDSMSEQLIIPNYKKLGIPKKFKSHIFLNVKLILTNPTVIGMIHSDDSINVNFRVII